MKLKVNSIFESIQGEGRYAGTPTLFVRLSGCNLNCPWCDTKYHKRGKYYTIKQLLKRIKKSKLKTIVWTGGEPTIQIIEITEVIKELSSDYKHHLETNGTLKARMQKYGRFFDYIAISPKDKQTAKYWAQNKNKLKTDVDIKIVTDLKSVGKDMISYADMLMPLTTFKKTKDLNISKAVWRYCVKNNFKFSPRLQIAVWGRRRKV